MNNAPDGENGVCRKIYLHPNTLFRSFFTHHVNNIFITIFTCLEVNFFWRGESGKINFPTFSNGKKLKNYHFTHWSRVSLIINKTQTYLQQKKKKKKGEY